MEAVNFPEQNDVLKAGENEDCFDLPICRTTDGKYPVVLSKWKLTKQELNEIKKTECIYFYVRGNTHPPITITSLNPFK